MFVVLNCVIPVGWMKRIVLRDKAQKTGALRTERAGGKKVVCGRFVFYYMNEDAES